MGLTWTNCAHPQRFPVCIVGAGPSGLTAAKRLEDKGRKVVIFEKQDSVGGKCQAVYETNTFHPLGALLFSNASYPETLKVIDVSGVPSVPFVTGQRWLYDVASGSTALSPAISSAFATLVGQEFQRYAVYWNTLFAPYSALRYKNGVPQELTVTTAQWLASNNYQALPVLFVQAMVAFGYGDLREVPILYMLQYLTPDILAFFARIHGVYLIDFHKVWVNWTKKSIKGPIYLRSTITKIDRSGPFPKITYQKAGNDKRTPRSRPEVQQCSSVILAFPPTVPALQAAKLNLTPDEITVFSPLTLISYFSGAVRLQTPRNLSFSAASPPNIPVAATGAPVSLLHLFNTSDIATTWSWGNNTSKAIARQLLKETLSKINKDPTDPAAVPVPVTDKDILGFQQNDYFPHFGPQELAAGWYDKFNKLQGVKNTYFASGLNGFETVEFALRAGSEIVETFF
ncbi:FAD/NAD-P-binding domain-containing protein [Rhexocercosporidium sp. MPI-PUGE-AT-0058]|nr:FAD/NAD-P-binding domain-containing protein [Rhexocercosporidium sp. MPI-PUGE-AT-0058]